VSDDPRPFWSKPQNWIWAVLAIVIIAWQLPTFVALVWPPRDLVSDFFQDWASARNLINGLPIYAEHTETIPRYVGEVDPICYSNLVNAHPPTSILLFIPLAPFEYRPALLIWNLAGLAMLGGSLWLVYRELRPKITSRSILTATVVILLSQPFIQQTFHGQLNLVLLLLITAAWAAERSERPAIAGALLGAATAIKLFPGFLFLPFAVRRQWRSLIAGAATVSVLFGLTAVILGPDVFPTYFQEIIPRLQTYRTSWFNASLVGLFAKLFDPATLEEHVLPLWRSTAAARAGILVSWTAVCGALIWCVGKAGSRTRCDHAFGATVTGMLLLSPMTWDYAFLLLIIPITLLCLDPPRSEPVKLLFVASLAALWFWQKPICQLLIPGGISRGIAYPVHTLTVLSYQCYSLAVLFILGVSHAADAVPRESR
jgi:hypothetical protein